MQFTLAATEFELTAEWLAFIRARMPCGSRVEVFPALGRDAFLLSPRLLGWLWTHVRNYDLVEVQALLNPISSAAAHIAFYRGVPYIVIPHGTLSRYTFRHRRSRLKRAYFQLVERHTLSRAAAVRFTSEQEREEAPDYSASTPDRVIPHPHEPLFARNGFRERNASTVLFLSRLHPVKGIDLLLSSFCHVHERIPGARLVLAGSGSPPFERRIRSSIERLDLDEFVDLPGFVEGDAKRRLLMEASVFVLPSQQENFGIAVVEAMDAGLPVVVTRDVDIWPRIEEAEAGFVVHERTPEAMAHALKTLLQDRGLCRRMGRNGQELVRTEFAPATVGQELAELYDSVATRRTCVADKGAGP